MKCTLNWTTTLTAVLLALSLHGLLFLMAHPAADRGKKRRLIPPKTRFLTNPFGDFFMNGKDVRMVRSPVLFSLPSGIGFSRVLLKRDVYTRLDFSQQVESERFLSVSSVKNLSEKVLVPDDLMLTSAKPSTPGLPVSISPIPKKDAYSLRITLTPNLKKRVENAAVLLPVLTRQGGKPWAVRASVTVSEEGTVEHVFLDQPLKSTALNQQVLGILYTLRFKPDDKTTEGSVQIFSPEPSIHGGSAP